MAESIDDPSSSVANTAACSRASYEVPSTTTTGSGELTVPSSATTSTSVARGTNDGHWSAATYTVWVRVSVPCGSTRMPMEYAAAESTYAMAVGCSAKARLDHAIAAITRELGAEHAMTADAVAARKKCK